MEGNGGDVGGTRRGWWYLGPGFGVSVPDFGVPNVDFWVQVVKFGVPVTEFGVLVLGLESEC